MYQRYTPLTPSRTLPNTFVARVLRPFQEFAQLGSLGGITLLLCTAFALAWANSPWSESYFHLWELRFSLGPAEAPLTLTLHEWINDALMVVFFLLVGLEIKRELLVGELSSPRQAALPILAAIGGMVVPALIYAAFNRGSEGMAGWGIPMATDIAFALGVLALLGPRVPVGLKVFLAALAIVDDLGAVLVIALFYTSALSVTALIGAAICAAILVALNRARVTSLTPYVLVGIVLWLFVLHSGVHATIAGVILAMTIPTSNSIDATQFSRRARALLDDFDAVDSEGASIITSKGKQDAVYQLDVATDDVTAPLLRLEHRLNLPVSFLIMPLFAIASAGVRIAGASDALGSPVAHGVAAGLVVGKAIGISLFSWLAIRFGFAALPAGVTVRMLFGVACLGGIGFTMSLFIAGLAFGTSPLLIDAKLAVLAASTVAGIAGFLILRRAPVATPNATTTATDVAQA